MENLDDLGLFFEVQYKFEESLQTDELISNGSNIPVTKDNLNEYITKRYTT